MRSAIIYETKLKNKYTLEAYLSENKFKVLLARTNSNMSVVIKALTYLVSDPQDIEFLRAQSLKDTPGEFYTGSTSLLNTITSDSVTLKYTAANCLTKSHKKATIEGLLKEYSIMSKLNHPQIVKPIEKGDDFFVMSYHYGKVFRFVPSKKHFINPHNFKSGLEDKLWRNLTGKAEDESQIWYSPEFKNYIRKFCSLLSTLEYIHQKGIVHKDIKPANLIDSGEKVVLIDFDIAEDLNNSREKQDYSQGTLQFVSPEEIRLEQLDFSADIYAMGMLLYQSIVPNAKLFRKSAKHDDSKYLKEKINREFVSPQLEFPIIPEKLADVVKKATMLNRSDRFNSASEMRSALIHACFKQYAKKIKIKK